MSRRKLRWLVLFSLLAGVAGLTSYNALSNARLLSDLQSRDGPLRAAAFAELSERQDNYNLLQGLTAPEREAAARNLGLWNDPRAAKLGVTILRDPHPEVRLAFVAALVNVVSKWPAAAAQEMSVTGAAERGGLLQAAHAAGEPGLRAAELAFLKPDSRENAAALFVRFGPKSKGRLARLLASSDRETALSAADTLARLGRAATGDESVAELIWRLYSSATGQERDRLFVPLAEFAPPEARLEFVQLLADRVAPPRLRAAAASGLGKLGDTGVLKAELADPDPAVARGAASALALHGAAGARAVIESRAGGSVKTSALIANPSYSAEAWLVRAAQGGSLDAVRALGQRERISPAAVRALKGLLEAFGSSDEMRFQAARSLAKCGAPGQRALLGALRSPLASWPAADALADSRVPEEQLKAIARGSGPDSRWAAVALRLHRGGTK